MSIGAFCELTLETADPEALAAFYADHLGLEVLQHQEDQIWLAVGPRARLGLWRPGEKEFGDKGGAHVHSAFYAETRRWSASGGAWPTPASIPAVRSSTRAAIARSTSRTRRANVVEMWDFLTRGEQWSTA